MNHNSKTILAVFAVIIMIGSALVPLAAGNCSGLTAADSSEDQENEVSLNNLVSALELLKEGFSGELKVGGATIVPAVRTADSYDEINGDVENKEIGISTKTLVESGKSLHLGGGNKYVFTETGKYVIKSGGKLVLSSLTIEKDGFTIVNSINKTEYDFYTDLVVLNSGALISYMGVLFKVVSASGPLTLFKCGNNTTVVFADNINADGKRRLAINVKTTDAAGAIGKLVILGLAHIRDTKDTEHPAEIEIVGDISYGDNTLSFSECSVTLSMNLRGEDEEHAIQTSVYCSLISFNMIIGFVPWDFKTYPDEPTAEVTMDMSCSVKELNILVSNLKEKKNLLSIKISPLKTDSGDDSTLAFSINGLKLRNESKIEKEEADAIKSLSTHRIISFVDTGSGTEPGVKFIGDASVKISINGAKASTMRIKGIDVSLTKFAMDFDAYGTKKVSSFILNSFGFDSVLSFDSLKYKGREITNFTFTLKDVSFVQEDEKVEFSTGVSKIDCKYKPGGAVYTLGVTIDFSGFVSDGSTIKGDIKLDASTKMDGAVKSYKISFLGLKFYDGSEDALPTLTCDKITFDNDIPMNKVFPTVENAQSFLGSFVIEGAELSISLIPVEIVLTAKYIDADFNILNNGIVDRVGFTINGEFSAGLGYDVINDSAYLNITGSNDITGYTKNIGDVKKKFAIEANSEKGVDVSLIVCPNSENKTVTLQVDYGKADFSNGGLIPAKLVIGENASFVGNDVSAMRFEFYNGEDDRSGTIMFDFSDGYSLTGRTIYRYSDGYETCVYRVEGSKDIGGYVISFDAKTLKSGTMKTNTGCLFVDGIFTGFENVTIDETNYANATFTTGSGDVRLYVYCVTEYFTMYYHDVDGKIIDSEYWQYGVAAQLEGTYESKEYKLIGWNDGSKFIQGEDKSGTVTATYVMPARDVHLYPVYAAVATVEDNKIVTDAPAVEIDGTQASEINTGFTIETNGAKIVMNDGAVKQIKKALSAESGKVVINVTEIFDQDQEAKKSVTGSNALYSIEITGNGNPISYSENTLFEVTLKVKFSGDISTFKVSYVDDNGHTVSVPLKSHKKTGSNTYDVTFEANHFSEYMVQPVFVTGGDMAIIFAVVAAVAVAAFAGLFVLIGARAKA